MDGFVNQYNEDFGKGGVAFPRIIYQMTSRRELYKERLIGHRESIKEIDTVTCSAAQQDY
jgi:hypothetical protein